MYWKFASLLIFAIFCGWCFVEMKTKTRKEDKEEEKFWDRERAANATRRKPIDHLDYVKISDELPYECLPDNDSVKEILATIDRLKGEKILNLTGYTNTDLKLMYGAPNITELTLYDQNFTALVTSCQKWADILSDNNLTKEALTVMEYIVEIGGDIGKSYRLLAKEYRNNNDSEKYQWLLDRAEALKSLNKPYIVKAVKEIYEETNN